MEEKEIVTLLLENIPLKCNKQLLIKSSSYFKVMFEGNFTERNKSIITLAETDYKPMQIILNLLEDKNLRLYCLNDDDILPVLQTACMLQFETIQQNCLEALTEKLSPQNCIKIWFVCEFHDVRPLYLKAKNMALIEFNAIKESSALFDFDLKQLHSYLANTMLQCRNELDVFTACMWWFYQNGDGDFSVIIKLLSCVDFGNATDQQIRNMMLFPDVRDNKILKDLFLAILQFKNNEQEFNIQNTNGLEINDLARFFCKSKKRNKSFVDPVVFVRKGVKKVKDNKCDEDRDKNVEVCYDVFKRKRQYQLIGGVDDLTALLYIYDMNRKKYIKCINVPEEKYIGVEGFHIVGYKEQIFFFGGEVILGSGHWNLNFWVYDTIRDRWEIKTRLPLGRRHFQSCICGPYLYIIGGTGSFRILQDNMFWYNYIDNIWSTQVTLPWSAGQLRSCNINGQLLLVHMNNKCGYLYSNKHNSFATLQFQDDLNLVSTFPQHFSLYAQGDCFYVKGTSLIEFQLLPSVLRVTNVWNICNTATIDFDNKSDVMEAVHQSDIMESIVCNNSVLTLYKNTHTKTVQLEIMPLPISKTIVPVTEMLPTEIDGLSLDLSTKLFALQHHYKMADTDVYVNDLTKIDCDILKSLEILDNKETT